VIRAIGRPELFEAGTNLQAWLFTILRNQFLTVQRKRRREVEDTDGSYAATMVSIPDQEDRIAVHELEAALAACRRSSARPSCSSARRACRTRRRPGQRG
jgi:RNA polymerase sigma-70 factor (ECF subfamily)